MAFISIVLLHEMQELVLDLDFILSLNEMFGMNHISAMKGLRSSNSKSFYENILILK